MNMTWGLNLFSIRNLIDTEEKFADTAKALKEMGYSYIQYSGGPYDPDRILRVSQESGLPVVLTHVPYDRIINDTDKLVEEHKSFGCDCIGLGALPLDALTDEQKFVDTVAAMEKAGARMQELGVSFFYHHHHFEFARFGDKTFFDYMVENAPHINFTLDTYWLQYGGVSICDTIDRLAGRVGCLHLKDYKTYKYDEGATAYKPIIAPVGDGNIDFKAVVRHALAAGTKHFLVEQDNAATMPDTLGQVERSIRYLNKNLAEI